MKKILFLIALTITLSINGFAQYKPFQFGLNVSPGLNMTNTQWEGSVELENYISFNWDKVTKANRQVIDYLHGK